MTKFTINGVEFNNFGPNNYSHGMELISSYPMPENIIQKVLNGEFHGVWLNPSAPCDSEFYGVFGTREQYNEFYKSQKAAQISTEVIRILGGYDALQTAKHEDYVKAEEQAKANYKDWWL